MFRGTLLKLNLDSDPPKNSYSVYYYLLMAGKIMRQRKGKNKKNKPWEREREREMDSPGIS